MKKVLIILLLLTANCFAQWNQFDWFKKSGLITLTANTDTVRVCTWAYTPASGIAIGNAGKTAEWFVTGNVLRIRQNGFISKFDIDFRDTSSITEMYLKIWRFQSATFKLVSKSENWKTKAKDGATSIYLTTPIWGEEGDYYSIYLVGGNDSTFETSAGYGVVIKKGTEALDGENWNADTTFNTNTKLIICNLYSTPAPIFVYLGNSLVNNIDIAFTVETGSPGVFLGKTMPRKVGMALGYTEQAMGFSGETTTQLLNTFYNGVTKQHPVMGIFEGAWNDLMAAVATTTIINNFTAELDSCIKYNIYPYVILVPPSWSRSNAEHLRRDTVNALLTALTLSKGGTPINLDPILGVKRDTGTPALLADNLANIKANYTTDGIHWNDTGMNAAASYIASIIKHRYYDKLTDTTKAIFTHTQVYTSYPRISVPLALTYTRFDYTYTTTGDYMDYKKGVNGSITSIATTQLGEGYTYTVNWSDTATYAIGDTLYYRFRNTAKYTSQTSWYNVIITVPWSTSLVPTLTSDSSATPIRVSCSSQLAGGYEVWKAFDADTTGVGYTPWATNVTKTGWIIVDFGTAKIVTSYALFGRGAVLNFDAKTWGLYGSTDNSTWVQVDSQTNASVWTLAERRAFTIATPTSYRYYRWYVSVNQGGNYLESEEIRLYGYTDATHQ